MKKKKRRKKWPVVVGILMGLFILAAGAVVLFRTRTVEVEGNSIYSENTIATWVQKDKLSVNTLYLLVKYNFLDSELPVGVEQMDVSLKNPWTVHVKVEEKELAGYVDCSGTYIEDAPYIEGLTFDESDVEIGKTLPVEDDSIFGKIVDASRYLKKYSLAPDRISCVEGDVRLYFGIVEVLLGDGGYEEKLQQVEPILDKLAELYPKTAGTLHLENYDSASDAISFVPAG